jgi:hypothetical protein
MTISERHMQRGPVSLLAALLLLALLGVGSLALAPLDHMAPPNVDPQLFRWLALVQPAILAIGATYLGYMFAPRVGLEAPLLTAALTGGSVRHVFIRQLGPAMIGGAASTLMLILYALVAPQSAFQLPLLTKLLYGGVTEEIIARWGVMSFLIWVVAKLLRGGNKLATLHVRIGIVLAALLFAAGHLPVLLALAPPPSAVLLWSAFASNMIPALMFGWLFQRHGLEAAIMAHAIAHVGAATWQAIS